MLIHLIAAHNWTYKTNSLPVHYIFWITMQLFLSMSGLLHMYNPMLLLAEDDIFDDTLCSGTSFPITCVYNSGNNTDLIQHLKQSQSSVGQQEGWQFTILKIWAENVFWPLVLAIWISTCACWIAIQYTPVFVTRGDHLDLIKELSNYPLLFSNGRTWVMPFEFADQLQPRLDNRGQIQYEKFNIWKNPVSDIDFV